MVHPNRRVGATQGHEVADEDRGPCSGNSHQSASAEPFVGGLTGGAESLSDLFPGCAVLIASQSHVGAGESVGGGGHAGGRNCQGEVT